MKAMVDMTAPCVVEGVPPRSSVTAAL